jgi:hypothetical protein
MADRYTAELTCRLLVLAVGAVARIAFGFSSEGFSVTRTLSQATAMTNSPVQVTVEFSNGQSNLLRGFFYSEQVPNTVSLTLGTVTLNGLALTNFVFEKGAKDDVYGGYAPVRWRLESPTNFAENNPVPGQGTASVSYWINSSQTGVFSFPHYAWAASLVAATNPVFGASESSDQRSIKFVDRTNLPVLTASYAKPNFTVRVDGDPGIYQLACSSNLVDWVVVSTNASPFQFTNRNPAEPANFYRGTLVQPQ